MRDREEKEKLTNNEQTQENIDLYILYMERNIEKKECVCHQ